jgi:integral membrane protein
MWNLLATPLSRLRLIGFVEGLSFLALVGVAMPLKYIGGNPEPVSVVGMVHGILWVLFVASVWDVRTRYEWPLMRAFWALLSSVIPFGTFVLDAHLREEEARRLPLPG